MAVGMSFHVLQSLFKYVIHPFIFIWKWVWKSSKSKFIESPAAKLFQWFRFLIEHPPSFSTLVSITSGLALYDFSFDNLAD
jgi:hypothetical protein